MKKFVACLLAFCLLFCVSVAALSSEAYQDIEEPTSQDLIKVPNPTMDDFSRLSVSEQQTYLVYKYSSGNLDDNTELFVEQYFYDNGISSQKDVLIAQEFFVSHPDNINTNAGLFEDYMQEKGVDFVMEGYISQYDSEGIIYASGQSFNIDTFARTRASDDYTVVVTGDGEIELRTKNDETITFTGDMEVSRNGRFNLEDGTINGHKVVQARQVEFNDDGDIAGAVVQRYDGIIFDGFTSISTEQQGARLHMENAIITEVQSYGETYVTGSAYFVDYPETSETLYVPEGETFAMNGIVVAADETDVEIRIGEDNFVYDDNDDYFGTLASEALIEDDQAYIRLGTHTLVLNGEGFDATLNADRFTAGEDVTLVNEYLLQVHAYHAPNGRYYKRGDTSKDVQYIERFLQEQIDPDTGEPYMDPSAGIDLVYDSQTAAAVEEWQRDNGLSVDGAFGSTSLEVAIGIVEGSNDVRVTPTDGVVAMITDGTNLYVDGTSADVHLGQDAWVLDHGDLHRDVTTRTELAPLYVDGETMVSSREIATSEGTHVFKYVADSVVYFGRRTTGEVAGMGLVAVDAAVSTVGLKEYSPNARRFIDHYVSASGEAIEMVDSQIPDEWKEHAMGIARTHSSSSSRRTGDVDYDCAGRCYDEVSSYNVGIFDMQNTLGTFDMEVVDNGDGTTTYHMYDYYVFGAPSEDPNEQSRHGFGLGNLNEEQVAVVNQALPSMEFDHPAGYTERLEVDNRGGTTYLFIPQRVLEMSGEPFDVQMTFTVDQDGQFIDSADYLERKQT